MIRNFEIIGEASKHLSPEIRKKYSDVAWKKIAGLRDKLIHDYMGVDLWSVWNLVSIVLPDFHAAIIKIILAENERL